MYDEQRNHHRLYNAVINLAIAAGLVFVAVVLLELVAPAIHHVTTSLTV